jgi:hypothetical protein
MCAYWKYLACVRIRLGTLEVLPMSGKWDVTLVVVDKLTKYAHALLFNWLRHISTIIYKLHGLPHHKQLFQTERQGLHKAICGHQIPNS